MTIQECYAQMGADYNEVFRRLYNEAMIRKFVLLFPKDDSFHNLEAALKEQNVKEAFRAAHTLKGVCQNLGFSNLYAPAVTLTAAHAEDDALCFEDLVALLLADIQHTVFHAFSPSSSVICGAIFLSRLLITS